MKSNIRHRPLGRPARAQAGFTLVELITVILILGVLAAVALPKFADLQGKARAAKVNAVAGSMKAAAGLVKAQAMASAVSCNITPGSVTMEGTAISLDYCYPQASTTFAAGILGAANVQSTDNWTASGGGTSPLVLQLSDAATPASCAITYTPAASAAGVISAPSVTTVVSAC